jgi:hypothetical protein
VWNLLREAARDPEARVRQAAQVGLGRLPDGITAILDGLRDGDRSVRAQAASTLLALASWAPVRVEIIEELLSTESDAQVRELLELAVERRR